jgi:farnesyl-diphosphate farnesyltransferase
MAHTLVRHRLHDKRETRTIAEAGLARIGPLPYDARVTEPERDQLIGPLLRDVSRSFYLTLRVLPGELRPAISLAYLFARASDTIADTKVVPRDKRRAHLIRFRRQFADRADAGELALIRGDLAQHQSLPAEKLLLERLEDCFAMLATLRGDDQRRIAELLGVITGGQESDLVQFPGETQNELAWFENDRQLDDYTYAVAGCVGKFWTEMCVAHLEPLRGWDCAGMTAVGIRFGKGLQLTNILRDLPRDLRIARCYVPSQELATVGLKPADLLDPAAIAKFRPLYDRYLDQTVGHLDAACRYTLAIPRSLPRLRLACAWPILIGLKTIALLRRSRDVLNPALRIMVPQSATNWILAKSLLAVRSDAWLERWFQQARAEAAGEPAQ